MNGESIRSCITLAVQAQGTEITTVEGLATGGRMHPLQEAFWEQQGLQCGYCTPGMLLRSLEFLRENPNPTREEAREAIASNLCRCTGYQFIVDAVLDAARHMREGEAEGEASLAPTVATGPA
jgi:carbon-monoxide dehydrogenase small subunit